MKVQREIFALLFIGLVTANIAKAFHDCFTSKDTFECRLGPMTPYRLVANRNDTQLQYSNCSPKKIWLFIRHGTRYPGKEWTARMMKMLPEVWDRLLESHRSGDGVLSDEDAELFRRWKFKFSDDEVMKLAEEGERELAAIAKRFQSRFPTIMPQTYDNETYKFKYTATQRTQESAKHFALGLFGPLQSLGVSYPTPEHRDPILRFYKSCKRWREEVDENPESYKENEKFVKGSMVRNLVDEVSKRVGFELDYGQVRSIYMICAFETAWYENYISPWCTLLSLENFKVLEFAQDLQYYWIDGYGYSLTYEQACSAMKDVFDFFGSEQGAKASVYFTHSGALLKLLALLGIAKEDQALRHDAFDYEDKRAWRTSLIDSFASNIAFILYESVASLASLFLEPQQFACLTKVTDRIENPQRAEMLRAYIHLRRLKVGLCLGFFLSIKLNFIEQSEYTFSSMTFYLHCVKICVFVDSVCGTRRASAMFLPKKQKIIVHQSR